MISLRTRWMRILAHIAPSQLPGSATWRSNAIMRNSFSSTALNDTSFRRLRMSRAELGVPGLSTGLIGIRIVSCDRHSRTSGVMVGFPE